MKRFIEQADAGICRRLDHVGIAVADLEAAARHYTEVLGFTELERERLPHQGVEAVLLDGGNCRVELLGALGENSPIAAFLAKNREGLQHLAFETADLDAALAHLAEHGIEPIRPPSVGAGGLRICFLHPKHTRGVLLELTEYPKG